MDTKGIRFAALYSVGCPELRGMGCEKEIRDFLLNPEPDLPTFTRVAFILGKLEPFFFYQLIALINDVDDVFSKKVVRAYWLSDSLLHPLTKNDVRRTMFLVLGKFSFDPHNVHKVIIKAHGLIGAKPWHNADVIYILAAVKNAPIPETLLVNANNCLVTAGRVIGVDESEIDIETFGVIQRKSGKICFVNLSKGVNRGFVKDVKTGDYVSVHLGIAREKITQKEAEILSQATKETVDFFQGG